MVKDFYNLVDVYLDAVLYPNCVQDPKTFAQEGWHYELENPEVSTLLSHRLSHAQDSPLPFRRLVAVLCTRGGSGAVLFGGDNT